MMTTKQIWMNGKFVPWEDAKVHVLSHTLHYGGGVFEGIRCYKTTQGSAVFRLHEHVDRLLYSASVLHMPFTYSHDEICTFIKTLLLTNNLDEGYIRPLIIYGHEKMGVNPVGNSTEFIIACWPWGAYLPHESIDIKTSSFIRVHPKSTIVDAKLCGNYLNGILAALEIQGTHYHEALFLSENGLVSEGVGENLFVAKAGVLYTPKLGTILPGITRDTITTLAKSLGYNVVEANLKLEDIYQADEAFFTGTAAEVTPIRSLDDRMIGGGQVGPISRQIKSAYMDIVRGNNPNFSHYLTLID